MKVDAQKYLELTENSNDLCFWDIEATGLKGDYDSILVVSILPYHGDPITLSVDRVGNDREVVKQAKDILENFGIWCGFYSRGYDIKMLNTRLFKWKSLPVEKSLHLDLYFQLKSHLSTSRRSQAHYMNWFKVDGKEDHEDMEKMSVGADTWSEMAYNMDKHMPIMIKRCESDVKGLRALYDHTKILINDITR